MGTIEVIKKFIKSSYVLEKVALEIYERLPLYLRERISYGSTFLQWVAFLKESEKWDIERLNTYQLEQLKNLLKHSKKNILYYRRLFYDCGFDPEKIQSLEDIRVLPYLDRETVRDRLEEFIDEDVPRKSLIKDSTSGSTGIPLTIYMTREAAGIYYYAFILNSLNRINYNPKAREVQFWDMIELGKRQNLPFMKYGNKLILSNRHLTDEWLFKYVRMMREFKPRFITGNTSTLSILSTFIKSKDTIPFKDLKGIIVHGETLYDWQRTLIGEVFGVRVFSVYGMTELSLLASECEYSASYHIYPQSGFAEFAVLDGGYEEIIATGFTNYAMPFIRYRTGDIIRERKEFCTECRRYHQLIGHVEGRINDFLINKEGKVIPRLMPWIKVFPNTKQCQFFQEKPGEAYLKIVKTEKYSDADTIHVRSKLREMLGPMKDTINIEIVFVDHIPGTSSGKIKLVDQRLDVRKFLGL